MCSANSPPRNSSRHCRNRSNPRVCTTSSKKPGCRDSGGAVVQTRDAAALKSTTPTAPAVSGTRTVGTRRIPSMAATDPQPGGTTGEAEQPFLSHLMELRDRLLRMIVAIVLVSLVLLPFANHAVLRARWPAAAAHAGEQFHDRHGGGLAVLIPIKLALVSGGVHLRALICCINSGASSRRVCIATNGAWPCRCWYRARCCSIWAARSPISWCSH